LYRGLTDGFHDLLALPGGSLPDDFPKLLVREDAHVVESEACLLWTSSGH